MAQVISSSSGGPADEFSGQSYESCDEAVSAAAQAARDALAGKTLENMEVLEFRGGFNDGRLQYQVSIRVWYA